MNIYKKSMFAYFTLAFSLGLQTIIMGCNTTESETSLPKNENLLAIKSPAPGTQFKVGEQLSLNWKAVETAKDRFLTIDISLDGNESGVIWSSLVEEAIINEKGNFNWTIPSTIEMYNPVKETLEERSSISDNIYIIIYEYEDPSVKVTLGPLSIVK